ncbi:MAG: DUF2892 domain-containing protein [Taibaiella sp.]|nr:DUF2892 domain-containing protein [Taibaiella sp.]
MNANMTVVDRLIRMLAVAIIAVLYIGGKVHGSTAGLLLSIAVIFFATSFTGFCPLYRLFGIGAHRKHAHR